jgi:hypothetical protein
MKLTSFLLKISFLLVFLLWTGSSLAQDCDICSHPRLAFYDAQMPPRPSTADSIVTWWTLQWPMAVARVSLHNTDPTRDCITWYDGALVNARDLQGDTLRIGLEYFNYPPAGEVNADYLLTGSITGSGGTYYLNLTLETAVSREVVLTHSVSFGSDIASQQSAGEAAAAAFMPLLQTIRSFEVNKRNTDVTVAMRDRESAPQPITVTPKKKKINTGEAVDVDIEMIDCDGVPLGNREISFIETTVYDIPFSGSTGGTVEPSTVTTDANGKATVKFTAGSTTGIGQIVASYPHRKPCGRASGFMRSAVMIIGTPPEHRWLVHAEISEQIDRYIDTVWSNGYSHITDQSWGNSFHNRNCKERIYGFIRVLFCVL